MGVPKFFRYISERYPCLSELVRQNEVPEFDNLYLDMNGIIHNCSHPSDDVHFRLSESQIFRDIFNYLEMLFKMIKPMKLFFMAVDGVAPRAKMNQQRGRRFRAAKDAETQERAAMQRGEKLPEEKRFDSNCITPGTEFMVRLNDAIKYFIKQKISTDPTWQSCKVILSGHETPGEGEHKIMEYIRFLKSQPDYDINTRHCLYGLDADLIMLGLCTHEPHFSLLREEVKFGKNSSKTSNPLEINFFLLHLSLLRDYLELEFKGIKDKLKFPFDIECIIDDWILMGFLIGNDFIPNLPNLHINTGALPLLYEVYMSVLPEMDGYMNTSGQLNLERFEKFLTTLGKRERELFAKNETNLDSLAGLEIDPPEFNTVDDDFAAMVSRSENLMLDEDDNEDSPEDTDFRRYREHYYKEKMKYVEINEEMRKEQTICYITAIQWNLNYYYNFVPSWSWYYPYHFAPFISDICNFKNLQITFDIAKPFLPFEQLLSVLPSGSRQLLPEAYRSLMTDPNSKIIHFYPSDFATDLNGKKNEWEAVVLIPFIDEVLLLEEMKHRETLLTSDEQKRNIHGPLFLYQYCPKSQGSCEGPYDLSDIPNVFCTEERILSKEIIDRTSLVLANKKLNRSLFHPGFPTFKHLKYTGDVRNVRVNVFDQPSRNESLIIEVTPSNETRGSHEEFARKIIGKDIFVNWPFLTQALVVKVSDSCNVYYVDKDQNFQSTNNERWRYDVSSIQSHHLNRMGIDVGPVNLIVHVIVCTGFYYVFENNKYVPKKAYSTIESAYPVQIVVQNFPSSVAIQREYNLHDVIKFGSPIILKVSQFFGCFGEVIDTNLSRSSTRFKVSLVVPVEPCFEACKDIHYKIQRSYVYSSSAAAQLGLSEFALLRLTDSVFYIEGDRREQVEMGVLKIDIGLQIKSKKANMVLPGYTKKFKKQILYSPKALELVAELIKNFPAITKVVDQNRNFVFESDFIALKESSTYAVSISSWIKSLPVSDLKLVPASSEFVEIEAKQDVIAATRQAKLQPARRVLLQVKPAAVYLPEVACSSQPLQARQRFKLFDRVVLSSSYDKISVGQRGTIMAIHSICEKNPVRQTNVSKSENVFDILFDKIHSANDAVDETYVANIPKGFLINLNTNKDTESITGSDRRQRVTIQNQNEIQKFKTPQQPLTNLWESMKQGKTTVGGSLDSHNIVQDFIKNVTVQANKPPELPPTSTSEDQASNILKEMLGINNSSAIKKPMVQSLPLPPESWKIPPPTQILTQNNFIPLQVMRNSSVSDLKPVQATSKVVGNQMQLPQQNTREVQQPEEKPQSLADIMGVHNPKHNKGGQKRRIAARFYKKQP